MKCSPDYFSMCEYRARLLLGAKFYHNQILFYCTFKILTSCFRLVLIIHLISLPFSFFLESALILHFKFLSFKFCSHKFTFQKCGSFTFSDVISPRTNILNEICYSFFSLASITGEISSCASLNNR